MSSKAYNPKRALGDPASQGRPCTQEVTLLPAQMGFGSIQSADVAENSRARVCAWILGELRLPLPSAPLNQYMWDYPSFSTKWLFFKKSLVPAKPYLLLLRRDEGQSVLGVTLH